jgi:hypothetical protein
MVVTVVLTTKMRVVSKVPSGRHLFETGPEGPELEG